MKKSLLLHVFGKSHSPEVVIPVAVVVRPGKAVVALAQVSIVYSGSKVACYRIAKNIVIVVTFLHPVAVCYRTGTA